MADTELAEIPTEPSTTECRFRNGTNTTATRISLSMDKETSTDNQHASEVHIEPKEESVDIGLIQQRTYLLSAWIGDTNRKFNRFKGWIGLVVWAINVIIHFGLDFYEAKFVFEVSWATCIGLFLVTLLACCYSMIKHSVPWFIKGVKKLQRDGHYPKTLRRLYLMFKYMPFIVVMFAMGAAMGQFGCYAYDGALRLSFSKLSNETGVVIPAGIDILFNVLRATSLTHIFYGFALILVFHMSLIFMIQSSMHEFNDRMGKLFRENPIQIGFPDAVNLFSARAKFVREGSLRSSVVLTTLLVACSTSFVLNAYNFLFLNRFAIYIWFAIAPLIWVVAPLTGAAWVTKTYVMYKLVVVNAWVDIPEEHELEAKAHEHLHEKHSGRPAAQRADSEKKKHGETEERTGVTKDAFGQHVTDDVVSIKSKVNGTPTFRKNSNTSLDSSADESTHGRAAPKITPFTTPPQILLTNYDEADDETACTQVLFVGGRQRSRSDPMLTVPENIRNGPENAEATSSSCGNGCEKLSRSHVVIIDDDESMTSDNLSETTRGTSDSNKAPPSFPREGSLLCGEALASLPRNDSSISRSPDNSPRLSRSTKCLDKENVCHQLKVPPLKQTVDVDGGYEKHEKKSNLLSGIAKTFHQWRTKTKRKRKFNYEKYIIYLESILPTVGFSIGGVIITFNGIYTFIVILSFLVGVFAQEAFFGN